MIDSPNTTPHLHQNKPTGDFCDMEELQCQEENQDVEEDDSDLGSLNVGLSTVIHDELWLEMDICDTHG